MKKKFGIWLATALVVGNIIGSGIFMLPGGLAPFGWNAVVAWSITFVGVLCLAWVYAMLARHLPNAGGGYGIMRMAVGDRAAFLGSWGYVVSVWAANAAITVAGMSYLSRLVPALSTTPAATPIVALSAIWLLTWINLRGLQVAGLVQLVTASIKLLPFMAVIGLAVWRLFDTGTATMPPLRAEDLSLSSVAGAAGLTLYAMLGLESATIPSDAVENPERVVPLATMIGTGVSAVVSLVATCAVALMLPLTVVTASVAPISDFIAISWGSMAGGFVALCAIVSCFGCVNGWILVGGELPAAMADAGALPAWFGARNAAGAPVRSVLVCAVATSLLVLMAYTRSGVAAHNFVALLAASTGLVIYVIASIAVFRFTRDGRLPKQRGLLLAGGVSFIFSFWALYGTGVEALGWGAVLIAAGWPLYFWAQRAARAEVAATN